MKKLTVVACFLFFFTFLGFNIIYAKSDFDNYSWQKLDNYFTGRDIIGITNNGSLFIAVGERGLILKSLDGISWEKVYCGYEEDFYSINYDGKSFKAVTQSGKVLTSENGDIWILQADKLDVNTSAEINIDPEHVVSRNKIFGYSKYQKIAIGVGESGAIYYGTKGQQDPIKQVSLNSNSHIIDKLGNAVALFVGSSQMYVENNYIEHSIPKPYTITSGKNEVVYVPLEEISKGIGGSYKFDQKESTAYINYRSNKLIIKLGEKTIKVNGKDKVTEFPAVLKDNKVFAPLNTFALLGKQIYLNQNLIIISDIKEFFDYQADYLIIAAMKSLFESTDHKVTSLSEKLIDTLTDKGFEYYDSPTPNGYFDALDYFEMAELIEPNSETYKYIGWTWHELEDFDTALEYFDKGLRLNSESFDLYLSKAYALSVIGKFDEALNNINQADKIKLGTFDVKACIAFLNLYKGEYEEAVKGYDECILINPSIAACYFNKGYSLMELGRYQEALDCYDKAIEMEPNEVRYFWRKGQCLYRFQKYNEAIVEFDNALKLNSEAELIIEDKGNALLKLNKYKEAALEYKKAIKINPFYEAFQKDLENVLLCMEKLGDELSYEQKYDEAVAEYSKALELIAVQSDYERVVGKKTELLYKMKRYEQLVNEMNVFESKYNDNELSNYYKALGYCAQAKYDDAIKCLKQSIYYDRAYRKRIYKDERFYQLRGRDDYKGLISEIKIFMDDTFLDGAEFFEVSMFEGATFYKTNTLGSISEDNTVKTLIKNILGNFLNNKINDKEAAKKIGISDNSPLLSLFDFDKEYYYLLRELEYGEVVLDSEIIMCGNINGEPKFVVVNTKMQRTNGSENVERYQYSLLIKEGGSWKYFTPIF